MAKPIVLEIISGLVTNVEFVTETVAAAAPRRGQASQPGRTVNAMKLLLRDPSAQRERDFTVRNSTVGVQNGHRLVLIRTKTRGHREPLLLAVVNQSTGQSEERTRAVEAAGSPKLLFGARWKAAGASVGIWAISALVSHYLMAGGYQGWGSVLVGAIWGLVSFPLFWLLFDVLGRFGAKAHRRQTRALVKAEIDHQIAIAKAVATGA
jgi:hypothetical protein